MRTAHKHLSPLRSRDALTMERLATLRAEVSRILERFPDLRACAARKTPTRRRAPLVGRNADRSVSQPPLRVTPRSV
ncbi:MAG TPA: hypothetical protein VKE51_14085 [Vicinamibacterales bacterium]|nr:hypothetical protein [Vicinamibacterales bacterium]